MFPEKLIEPVSDATPAGEDGVYTQPFQELTALAEYLAARLALAEFERLAKIDYQGENAESDLRVAQSNAEDGRRNVERAEAAVKQMIGRVPSPDAVRNELRTRAERMLAESGKDLRVVQQLALAWTLEQGVQGLEDALRLGDALLERYGAELHPKPDEDDPSDVSAREMVVTEMLNGGAFVDALRECVLLDAPGVGRFSGRDADVIDGRAEDDRAGGARSPQEIAAIAQAGAGGAADAANEALRAAAARVEACEEAVAALVGRFAAGSIHGDRVPELLARMRSLVTAAVQDASGEIVASDGALVPIVTTAGAVTAPAGTGGMRTRDDARRLILQVSKFLEETEPSHPAPFFLKRAERLLGAKDFFAIMRDMAPDAISEMERITGHRDSGSDST
jgi:type VI secretion system protein ImpA